MKYLKGFLILFLFVFIISCGQNKYEKKLNGTWYEIHGGTRFNFKKDTLTILEWYFPQKTEWKANNRIITFEFELSFADSLGEKIKKDTLFYNMNESNNRFTAKINIDTTKALTFIKADNYPDFLFEKNKISIKLPDKKTKYLYDSEYGFNVYLGYQNNKIIAKTDYSNNLDNLYHDLNEFHEKYKNHYLNYLANSKYHSKVDSLENDKDFYYKWIKNKSFYKLFIDKKLQKESDSIIKLLLKAERKDIYQVHFTKERLDYPFDIVRGKKITIANIMYKQ